MLWGTNSNPVNPTRFFQPPNSFLCNHRGGINQGDVSQTGGKLIVTTCGYHNLMKLPVAWQNFGEAEVVCKGKESMIVCEVPSCSPWFFQPATPQRIGFSLWCWRDHFMSWKKMEMILLQLHGGNRFGMFFSTKPGRKNHLGRCCLYIFVLGELTQKKKWPTKSGDFIPKWRPRSEANELLAVQSWREKQPKRCTHFFLQANPCNISSNIYIQFSM